MEGQVKAGIQPSPVHGGVIGGSFVGYLGLSGMGPVQRRQGQLGCHFFRVPWRPGGINRARGSGVGWGMLWQHGEFGQLLFCPCDGCLPPTTPGSDRLRSRLPSPLHPRLCRQRPHTPLPGLWGPGRGPGQASAALG